MEGKGGRDVKQHIKDTQTKPKRSRIESGSWGWLGWRGVVGKGDTCT